MAAVKHTPNTEFVILMDEAGQPTGQTLPKLDAHHSKTPLHLGFSCYVFDKNGKFLATQRAKSKKVWPSVWTNSVCGHPGLDETVPEAIKRRLDFELGMKAVDIQVVLPNYRYKTLPYKGIIENEICPVYVARAASQANPNPDEVEDLSWVDWDDFVSKATRDQGDKYSYWCKDQVKQLKNNDYFKKWTNK